MDITAEEALESGTVRVWSVIVEDHEMGDSAWGYFEDQEMMWIPVAFPLGPEGTLLDFSGPYPTTQSVSGNYTLNPSEHPLENLHAVTFVQYTGESKEVLNASVDELVQTGIEDTGSLTASLSVSRNPSSGAFSVSTYLPRGATGSVQIFDVTGRLLDQFNAGSTTDIFVEETGVYYIRLATSQGATASVNVVVLN